MTFVPKSEEGGEMTDEQFNALWSQEDFLDLHNEAFSGIPEWDSFAARCESCRDCNES